MTNCFTNRDKSPPFNAIQKRKSTQNYAEMAMLLSDGEDSFVIEEESFKRYLLIALGSVSLRFSAITVSAWLVVSFD